MNNMTYEIVIPVIIAFAISALLGPVVIPFLRKLKVGQTERKELESHLKKNGTPTMGGIMILASIIITSLFYVKDYPKIIPVLFLTLGFGLIGFLDDYIKVFRKHKEGLKGRFKVIGQVGLGLIVGVTLYVSDDVLIREKVSISEVGVVTSTVDEGFVSENSQTVLRKAIKSTKTTIPFFKNNEFDYAWFGALFGDYAEEIGWIVFIIITIVIVTAVSNGANLTDGLDGLATGTSAIVGATLGILAYVSGNMVYADYLNIMYIPHSGELVVFIAAFIGATIGFLWYNSFPAQVFMGDTGSLSLGGIIAVFAIMIHKELLIPILCGIFLVENLSVMMQVSYFKYTKKKFGEGRRIFLMSPLHHHFQKKGIPEPKIVTRFWIVGIALAVITIVTLKIR